jgi:phospho-N-acetylmuramoyl-pentapeptide-transferase
LPLADEGVNVFRYITFRTGAATLTALFLAFLLGPPLIRALSRLRVGQPIRKIGPDHQSKAGTPTMGGLMILSSLAISVLLWSELDNRFVDRARVTLGYGRSASSTTAQGAHAARGPGRARSWWARPRSRWRRDGDLPDPSFDRELAVPFFKDFTPNLGWLYVRCHLIIVGASNAVNLTDGPDGLAIGR